MKTLVISSVFVALQAGVALAAGGPGRVAAADDLRAPEAIAVMAEKKAEAIQTAIAAPRVLPDLSGVSDASFDAAAPAGIPHIPGGKTKG